MILRDTSETSDSEVVSCDEVYSVVTSVANIWPHGKTNAIGLRPATSALGKCSKGDSAYIIQKLVLSIGSQAAPPELRVQCGMVGSEIGEKATMPIVR